jgi:putative Holliday junction resolvase
MVLDATATIMALDVGTVRIGVARASALVRLPEPLTTLANDDNLWPQLTQICADHHVTDLVVGLPRGLDGQETAQTALVRQFVTSLQKHLDLPVTLQDEALTSRQAEAELARRGKTFQKGDVDALAAVYILTDYLSTHQHGKL